MMEYPTFVSSLANMAESEDPVAQAIALETVGYIGVSLEGKVLTHSDELGLNKQNLFFIICAGWPARSILSTNYRPPLKSVSVQ